MNITSNVGTERKRYLDAAKGWGITMVVFGHITSLGNPVDQWFGAYKLAIFYIVSGYLLGMRQSFRKMNTGQYVLKHFKSLMIPYFGYSAIVILYNILVGLMKGKDYEWIWHRFILQGYTTVSLRGISALWFLPSLFIAQILFILIIRLPLVFKMISAVVPVVLCRYVSLQLLPAWEENMTERMYKLVSFPTLAVSKGILAFWFVGAGYVAYFIFRKLQHRWLRFLIGVVMSAVTVYFSQINPHVDINTMKLGENYFLFYLDGIMGSLGAVFILEFLEKWWKMSYLSFCGKNSMIIMATHGTLGFKRLVIEGWTALYTLSETPGLRYYLEVTGILGELMLLECGVITIINQYFPWIAGRFPSKNQKSSLQSVGQ